MKNNRIASLGAVVIASLTLAGCGSDREIAYRDTQIQELERVNKELEMQLVACAEKKTVQFFNDHPNATPTEAGGSLIDHAHTSTRPTDFVISIENNVLFKPGSAELSTQAKNTLSQVIALIHTKYNEGYWIRVDGFTDDEKIVKSKDQWDDNWDLSGGRGQKVLHYLLDHGIAAAKLGFAGYGEQRPLEPNSSASNRSKNRRVEIVVIPKNPGK